MAETTDLIFVDPGSNTNKFWSATLDGCDYTVNFGRIGTTGQVKMKTLATPSAARAMYDKTVQEKLAKGYVDANVAPGGSRAIVVDHEAERRMAVAKLVGIAKGLSTPLADDPDADDPDNTDEDTDERDHAVLDAEWHEAFDALRATGLEADADHPIAARYRAASDAVNHANRSRDVAIATGQITTPTAPTRRISVPEVRPMLAEEVPATTLPDYIADDRWVIQEKLDGHRVCIHVIDGKVTVFGRSGQDSQHAPRFAQKAYADILRLDDCVLDGELLEETFWVFDLPVHAGEGVELSTPYGERLAALERVFEKWAPDETKYRLLSTARDAEAKGQLAIDVLKNGGEGVMVKDLNGTYKPGKRSKTTLKSKYVKTADVIVTDVGVDGKTNYALSVYRDGKLVECGRCSAIGKAVVPIGTVIEVKFLYFAVNDRLYQPRMMRVRTDKAAEECLWSQFDNARSNKTAVV